MRKCKEATKEAYAEVCEQVEKDLKAKDKAAAAREEALAESVENMQTALQRLETTSASKEQRMREENEHLVQRCTEAESRCQELSSAVPDSTRPLLRQIESLHANFAEKTRVWEQVCLLRSNSSATSAAIHLVARRVLIVCSCTRSRCRCGSGARLLKKRLGLPSRRSVCLTISTSLSTTRSRLPRLVSQHCRSRGRGVCV